MDSNAAGAYLVVVEIRPSNPWLNTDAENARLQGSLSSSRLSRITLRL